MGRAPCCSKVGLNRGPWTTNEDSLLTNYIQTHGIRQWRSLPTNAGLLRCGKSCRLRWMNYLRPDIKRGDFSPDEDDLIIRMHALLGNRWSLIAGRLSGRTDNDIKNYWNTNLSKKLRSQGIDPNTHKKISDLDQTPPKPKRTPKLKKKKPNKTTTTTTTKKQVIIMKPADEVVKVVLHQPKATRVKSLIVSSSALSFTRNNNFESPLTTVSPPPWPLYDLCGPMDEDRAAVGRAGFLIDGDQDYDMAVPHASSDLDKLYNEYFQLINHMDRDLDQARELDSFAESLLI